LSSPAIAHAQAVEQSTFPKKRYEFMNKIENKEELAIDFSDLKQWKTLKAFAKDNQHFTLDQLRLLTRHRDSNGLSNICKKIGKTLYLHEPAFSVWISQQ